MIHVEKAAYRCIYEIAHNGLPVFAATATLLASIKPIVEGGLNEELIQWLKDAQEVFQPKMSIVGPSHPHSLRQSASGPSTPYTDKPSVTTSLTSSSTSRERTPGPSNATGQDAECYSPASSHVRLLKSNPPTPAAARGARRSSRAQAKPQTPATSIPTKNRPAIKKQHKPVEVTQPAAKEFRPTRVQAEPETLPSRTGRQRPSTLTNSTPTNIVSLPASPTRMQRPSARRPVKLSVNAPPPAQRLVLFFALISKPYISPSALLAHPPSPLRCAPQGMGQTPCPSGRNLRMCT